MKTIILFPFLLLSMNIVFAQTDSKLIPPITSGNTTCTCQEGFTICRADALFMTCCTCCQRGSTCGAWTAFGLAGCVCESTGTSKTTTNSAVKFYFNKYNDFMTYLEKNGIPSNKLKTYAMPPVENKPIIKGSTPDMDYMILEGPALKTFTDAYVADLKLLVTNSNNKLILDSYLNKK